MFFPHTNISPLSAPRILPTQWAAKSINAAPATVINSFLATEDMVIALIGTFHINPRGKKASACDMQMDGCRYVQHRVRVVGAPRLSLPRSAAAYKIWRRRDKRSREASIKSLLSSPLRARKWVRQRQPLSKLFFIPDFVASATGGLSPVGVRRYRSLFRSNIIFQIAKLQPDVLGNARCMHSSEL